MGYFAPRWSPVVRRWKLLISLFYIIAAPCFKAEKRTCCIISLNFSSNGFRSAEMTGSLCKHTAAIKVHGEGALSVTLLVCKVPRQTKVLEKERKRVLPTVVCLKRDRNSKTERLAILPQGAAIFVLHSRTKKNRDAGNYSWKQSGYLITLFPSLEEYEGKNTSCVHCESFSFRFPTVRSNLIAVRGPQANDIFILRLFEKSMKASYFYFYPQFFAEKRTVYI